MKVKDNAPAFKITCPYCDSDRTQYDSARRLGRCLNCERVHIPEENIVLCANAHLQKLAKELEETILDLHSMKAIKPEPVFITASEIEERRKIAGDFEAGKMFKSLNEYKKAMEDGKCDYHQDKIDAINCAIRNLKVQIAGDSSVVEPNEQGFRPAVSYQEQMSPNLAGFLAATKDILETHHFINGAAIQKIVDEEKDKINKSLWSDLLRWVRPSKEKNMNGPTPQHDNGRQPQFPNGRQPQHDRATLPDVGNEPIIPYSSIWFDKQIKGKTVRHRTEHSLTGVAIGYQYIEGKITFLILERPNKSTINLNVNFAEVVLPETLEREEFEALTKPLIKYLNDRGNPHASIYVDIDSATLNAGEMSVKNEEFFRD